MNFIKEDPILHRRNYKEFYEKWSKYLGGLLHFIDNAFGKKDDKAIDYLQNLGYKEWFYYNGEIFHKDLDNPISFAIAFVTSNQATAVVGWIYVPKDDKIPTGEDTKSKENFYFLHAEDENNPMAAKVYDYVLGQNTFAPNGGPCTELRIWEGDLKLKFSSDINSDSPSKFSITTPKFNVEGNFPRYTIHLKDKDKGINLKLELEDLKGHVENPDFCKEANLKDELKEVKKNPELKKAIKKIKDKKLINDSIIAKIVKLPFDPICKWYHSGQVKIKSAKGSIGDINFDEKFKKGYSFYEKVWVHVPAVGAYWRWFDAHLTEDTPDSDGDYKYAFDVYLPTFLGIDVPQMQECWFCVEDKDTPPKFTIFKPGEFKVDPKDDDKTWGKHTLTGKNDKGDAFKITFEVYGGHDYPFNEPHTKLDYGMRLAEVKGTFNGMPLEGYGQIEFTPLQRWF